MANRQRPPLAPGARLRMDVVTRILDRIAPESLVEVGPGQGAASYLIAEGRDYVGYEPDPDSFEVAVERLAAIRRAEVRNEPLPAKPSRQFEALAAFEVLEHIEEDLAVLRSWGEWLIPGGHLIISVPAKSHRYGPWDEAVGHYRRYEAAQLHALVEAAGFDEIEIRAYGMPLGYALEWARQNVLAGRLEVKGDNESRTTRSGRAFQPSSGGTLIRAVTYPFVLMQRLFERTELGIGWVAVARRPD
jgi:SAM-dependent methyltransferase